jgi:hypothetical protein
VSEEQQRLVLEGELSLRQRPMEGEDVLIDDDEIYFESLVGEEERRIESDDQGYLRTFHGRWRITLEKLP